MEDWIILDEFHEAGRVIRLGKRIGDGVLYNFEPFATRLRGSDAGRFQKGLAVRIRSYPSDSDGAILPVTGPLCFEGQNWLGWAFRTGNPVFGASETKGTFAQNNRVHPRQLLPIIRTYEQFHGCGLVVGRPDWGRCYGDETGFFMIDPWPLAYLTPLVTRLPAGFDGCRPPESFRGVSPSEAGDRFYLGLILYYLLTGAQPYPLIDAWPTRALLAGDWLPPQVYRPELDPELSRIIVALLDPEPNRRPDLKQVAELWQTSLNTPESFIVPVSMVRACDLTGSRGRNRLHKYRWLDIWQRFWKPVSAAVFGVLLLLGLFSPVLHPAGSSPWSVTEQFYRDAGAPTMEVAAIDSGMLADFSAAKTERLQLAKELLSRPVVEVIRITKVSRSQGRIVLRAELRWWNWSGTAWNSRRSRELLVLQESRGRWEIKKRQPLGLANTGK